jgi:hypothetical protein
MKAAELLEIARIELDDVAAPFLWSNPEMLEYLDDGQNEAARRGRLLVDSTTTATCQITVVSGTHTYTLDPRVIRVNRARLVDGDLPLSVVMMRDLDCYPGWESWSETPRIYCPDWESGKIRLVGNPSAAGVLNMTVVRLPLLPVNDMHDTLELRAEHQRNLRHWVIYRAYLKRDSETYNPKKAAEALALFEREFGQPQPAYDELWMQQHYMTGNWNGRY